MSDRIDLIERALTRSGIDLTDKELTKILEIFKDDISEDPIGLFEKRTKEKMHSLHDKKTAIASEDIWEYKEYIKEYIRASLEISGIDADIVGIVLSGSRSRGLERRNSDLDVVVELSSNDEDDLVREDDVFNILHDDDEPCIIEGIKVDINPITAEDTGTLEEYLPHADMYLRKKELKAIIKDDEKTENIFKIIEAAVKQGKNQQRSEKSERE